MNRYFAVGTDVGYNVAALWVVRILNLSPFSWSFCRGAIYNCFLWQNGTDHVIRTSAMIWNYFKFLARSHSSVQPATLPHLTFPVGDSSVSKQLYTHPLKLHTFDPVFEHLPLCQSGRQSSIVKLTSHPRRFVLETHIGSPWTELYSYKRKMMKKMKYIATSLIVVKTQSKLSQPVNTKSWLWWATQHDSSSTTHFRLTRCNHRS